ncbi:LexA family protein [Dongia soli]|uniref:LexA repressor DNA-binding domain-containing protein n=1 Tax=Dongia soli TaxID=600628 RepID=A0ABU5E7M7_9PROT|nr:hypothetical protein [Dongia soli]MDY0882272.1 hypothetical protein [Dongia soli]
MADKSMPVSDAGAVGWRSMNLRYKDRQSANFQILTDDTLQGWLADIESGIRGSIDQLETRFVWVCEILLRERENRLRTRYPRMTPRHGDVLRAIDTYIATHGASPTYRNIAEITGYSMSIVFDAIHAGKKHGYISHDPHKRRSLRLTPRALEISSIELGRDKWQAQ